MSMSKRSIIIIVLLVVVILAFGFWDSEDKPSAYTVNANLGTEETRTFESTEWGFAVDVPDVEMQATASGELTTYEFGMNSITVLPENLESLLTSGVGNPETREAELGSTAATKVTGENEQNGVEFVLYYAKHKGNIISFQGTEAFLETVQETFKTIN